MYMGYPTKLVLRLKREQLHFLISVYNSKSVMYSITW